MHERKLIDGLFDDLFPIMRSITGPGIEESIRILSQYMPLKMTKIASGSHVFDWVVPPEWHFRHAKIVTPEGQVICDSGQSNLHVVNYTESVDKVVDLEELDAHLHSIPGLPDAIPYVTSYYSRTWGFCISQRQREQLIPGDYHVYIDTSFVEGGVPYAQCIIPGDSEKEILLTSYLCHPSLANNELSGPLVLLGLHNRIKKWSKRRFTYRFLLNPETIGSLCFLYKHSKELKKNMVSGLILTCLGGPQKELLYKSTRKSDSLIDQVMNYEDKALPMPVSTTPFCPMSGSDERQYCAPGFNLPMGQISRSTYGTYDGYHNSLDTKDFMCIDSLLESIDVIEQVLKYTEVCGNPVNMSPYGEPQLGKRNLYPNMNSNFTKSMSSDKVTDGRIELNRVLLLLNMADGKNSLIDIAQASACSVDDLIPLVKRLEEVDLINYNVGLPKL